MKKLLVVAMSIMFAASMSVVAFADCGMDHGKMGHDKMEHGGMAMHGDMFMLGDQVVGGVKGMAHLKDVAEAMSKMGMKETHHFMIMFADTGTGKPIETGSVAIKVTDPSGAVGDPVKLMGMQGHFGADVALTEKGMYEFHVGTKLADGEKRTYQFHFTVD